MRAVVEEWVRDKKGCLDAIGRRQKTGSPRIGDGRFIHAMLDIILDGHRDDANLMNLFARGASAIGEAVFEDECRVNLVADGVPAAWVARVYAELQKTNTSWLAIEFNNGTAFA